MPRKSAIVEVALYVLISSVALAWIATLIPPDLISLPVYATNGAISILFFAWLILRKSKYAKRCSDQSSIEDETPKDKE
jgi:hypothetical protein